jgi:RHS repeat-associated protein
VKKYYYHANNLYSIAAITDKNGTVVERYNYSPYGEATILDPTGLVQQPASSIQNPVFFTGRRLDAETGLMYYRARYYDAELGRFVGRDPLEYVDGLNMYEYVKSRSTLALDPSGLKWEDEYMGEDYFNGYSTLSGGTAPLAIYRGGSGEPIGKVIPPVIVKGDECECHCVKDGTGIAEGGYKWWGVKKGMPKPDSFPLMTDAFADDATWHERTEVGLLKKLWLKTVEIAAARSQEYRCSGGKTAKTKEWLVDYIKWDKARDLYLAQAGHNSAFDKKFSAAIELGKWVLQTPPNQYKESDYDQWYSPNLY